MDVALKKYFWIFNLVAIGLCAGFAGRAGSHLVEQYALASDDDAAGHRATLPPAEKVRTKDVTDIIKRDIFCSTCSPIVPTEESTDTTETATPGNQPPQRTTLQLELVSTMVCTDDEKWSVAVIRDLQSKTKDSGLYARGSTLPASSATVLRVIEKRVYLLNNNRVEFLDLEGANQPPAAAAPIVASSVVGGGDPADADIGNHVRCNGSVCEIDRALVDSMLANTTALATAARFVPSLKDGRPNGFKLYAIRPSSIFGRIGLQNGDTIKQINGMDMNSPDQALGVYTKVRNASHLTVAVERRGESVTLDYTIR